MLNCVILVSISQSLAAVKPDENEDIVVENEIEFEFMDISDRITSAGS